MATKRSQRKTRTTKKPTITKPISATPPVDLLKFEKIKFPSYDEAFMLRRVYKCCYTDTVIVDFKEECEDFFTEYQKYNQDGQQYLNSKYHKSHAVFNRDGRYYTPGFVIGIDLRDYIKYNQDDLQKFEAKREQAEHKASDVEEKENPQFFVPRPTGRKCQICKQQYGDYLEHTKSEKHLKLFKKSKGWKYVNEFVEEFQQKLKNKQNTKNKNKRKERQPAKPLQIDSEEQNQEENAETPKKKYKTKTITKFSSQSTNKKNCRNQKNNVLISATNSTVSPIQM